MLDWDGETGLGRLKELKHLLRGGSHNMEISKIIKLSQLLSEFFGLEADVCKLSEMFIEKIKTVSTTVSEYNCPMPFWYML